MFSAVNLRSAEIISSPVLAASPHDEMFFFSQGFISGTIAGEQKNVRDAITLSSNFSCFVPQGVTLHHSAWNDMKQIPSVTMPSRPYYTVRLGLCREYPEFLYRDGGGPNCIELFTTIQHYSTQESVGGYPQLQNLYIASVIMKSCLAIFETKLRLEIGPSTSNYRPIQGDPAKVRPT